MKWVRTLVLFSEGGVVDSEDWRLIHESYVRAIGQIDHPEGGGILTIRRKRSGPDGKPLRNGVGYLKQRFIGHIVRDEGWLEEVTPEVRFIEQEEITEYPSGEPYKMPPTSFGRFDFVTTAPNGTRVAIEWETGNVSSSHRSMNKMAIALASGDISAGVLLVPSRKLYRHLTDRIGNFEELRSYFRMWQSLKAGVERGLLAVTVVEHDNETDDSAIPYFRLGDDGNAARGRLRF